jgi:DNA-binding NarL/FixJ family response regulator
VKKPNAITVMIADDHSIVREGLVAIIDRQQDMEVVGQSRSWPEAIDGVARTRPAIAVLDLHMPGMTPPEGIAKLRKKCPDTQLVVFSAFGTHEEIYQVVCAGARGYVLKGESGRDDLLTCIRAVSRGEMWTHPYVAARLAERMTEPNLTQRETEILRLMAVGKSNKEIGSSLNVAEGTIKVHINHILGKLGVTGRVEAILVAAQRGLVRLVESVQAPHRPLPDSYASKSSKELISQDIEPSNSIRQLHVKK